MTGRTFVGRAREQQELRAALALAQTSGELVLICGEAGVGKTSLCREIVAGAIAAGTAVAWGQCRAEGAHAYAPWIEALRAIGRTAPCDAIARALDLLSGGLSGRTSAPLRSLAIDEVVELADHGQWEPAHAPHLPVLGRISLARHRSVCLLLGQPEKGVTGAVQTNRHAGDPTAACFVPAAGQY